MAKLSYETAQALLKAWSGNRVMMSIIYAESGDYDSALALVWEAIAKIESDIAYIEDDLDEIKED